MNRGWLSMWLSVVGLAILVAYMAGCGGSVNAGGGGAVPISLTPAGVSSAGLTVVHNGSGQVAGGADPTVGGGVPASVTAFRFSGLDDARRLSYGAVTVPRARSVQLTGVPSTVSRLLIEYIDGAGTVVATHVHRVTTSTVTVTDADVHAGNTAARALPSGVPCTPSGSAGFYDDWTPLYEGISYSAGAYGSAFYDCTTPRTQVVHALRIDLLNNSIGFVTTPTLSAGQTRAQPATDFLLAHQSDAGKLPVKVAVNANFFTPCCDTTLATPTPTVVSLLGLSISEGSAVNAGQLNVAQPSDPGAVSLLLRQGVTGFDARFQIITSSTSPSVWDGVETAISGGNGNPNGPTPIPQYLVVDNVLQPDPRQSNIQKQVAARTFVGLSAESPPRFMYIVTVDGREGSTQGADFFDSACWLYLAGANTGFSLDGGGSSTMAIALPEAGGGTTAQLIDVPYGDEKTACVQRLVGSVLGVRSKAVSNAVLPLTGCPP